MGIADKKNNKTEGMYLIIFREIYSISNIILYSLFQYIIVCR